jgi:hypothetical protein
MLFVQVVSEIGQCFREQHQVREVAEAVERIVGEPRVSRLSAPNGGAGEVFVQ